MQYEIFIEVTIPKSPV